MILFFTALRFKFMAKYFLLPCALKMSTALLVIGLSMPISCSPAKDLLFPRSVWSQQPPLASSLQPPALPLSTAWSDVLIPSLLFCHLCHFRVDSWPLRFGRACSQCVWADARPSLLFPPNLVPNHQPYFMDHPKALDCQNNFNYSSDGPRATSSIRGLPAADKD